MSMPEPRSPRKSSPPSRRPPKPRPRAAGGGGKSGAKGGSRSATGGQGGKPGRPIPSAGGRGPTPAGRVELPRDINQEVRQVARLKADEVLALLGRAVELLARGDSRQAVKEAERAKRLAPRSSSVREVLALGLYEQERYREALTEMQAYKRVTGRSDQNHIIADCYRALGQPQKAVQFADEAVRGRVSDESRAEAVVVGAAALADMGKIDQALAMLHRFSTKTDVGREYDLRVWYVTGDILERAGRPADAAVEFRKIVRHDSGAFDAAERLAALESA